jgi:hypothetical protein
MTHEAALEKFTAWLVQLYGARLQSLVVYGPAAGGAHAAHISHADMNLLAVLDTMDAAALELGAPAVAWWRKQGYPAPVMLSRDEQDDSADIFPVEYLDIQAHHRVLAGAELFAQVPRFPELHRIHVEHDLRAHLLRLRGAYMADSGDAKALAELLLNSVRTFVTLFRHALTVFGEPLVVDPDRVLAAAAVRFRFSPAPIEAILAARHSGSKLAEGKLDALRSLFAAYLAAITAVERGLEQNSE